ncbi:MAG: cupin domain-containing protein [Planctomycetota bacterium]
MTNPNSNPFADDPPSDDGSEAAELDRMLSEHARASGSRAPASLKDRLLRRLDASTGVQFEALSIRRGAQRTWQPTGVEGLACSLLSLDRERGLATMLLRMDPGAVYPAHRHKRAEECYVLEGDLCIGEQVLVAGDFQRAEAGSLHPDQHTESGCTVLLVASVTEDYLAGALPGGQP